MILKYLGKKGWALTALMTVLVVCQVYLDISIPGYMNDMTDAIQEQVVAGDGSTDAVVENGTKMIAAAFLSLVMAVGTAVVSARIASDLTTNIRRMEFSKVLSFSSQDISEFSAASLVTRSTNDPYQLMSFITRGLVFTLKAPITAILAIWMIWGMDLGWTAATGVAVAALIAITSAGMVYSMPRFKRIQWLTDGVNRAAREDLEGQRTVRAYNAEKRQTEKLDKASDDLLDNNLSIVHALAPMHPAVSSINNFLTLAIYWMGAGLIASAGDAAFRMQEFSDMVVFTSYASQVISAFMMMTGVVRMLPRALVASRRVEEVIDHALLIEDGPREKGEEGEEGTVEFRHVTFTYPGTSEKVLDDVSFRIGKGETLAIIGPTGGGKSSIVRLIPRLYDPDSGQVLIDGVDAKEYRQSALHSKIGFVPQDAVIFTGTVAENVAYGDTAEKATEEDVWKALEVAQARDFVEKSPDKLDTVISQYGRNISGGQKQRICIARAVCRRPEIYVFDDSFSALDFKTDLALREALKREAAGSTRIIVAQRVGTVMDADRIAVVDKGKIVGLGTHDELLKSCPVYREIAESQMGGGA